MSLEMKYHEDKTMKVIYFPNIWW